MPFLKRLLYLGPAVHVPALRDQSVLRHRTVRCRLWPEPPFRKDLSLWVVGIPKHQKVYPGHIAMIFPQARLGRPRLPSVPGTSLSGRRQDVGPDEMAAHR